MIVFSHKDHIMMCFSVISLYIIKLSSLTIEKTFSHHNHIEFSCVQIVCLDGLKRYGWGLETMIIVYIHYNRHNMMRNIID